MQTVGKLVALMKPKRTADCLSVGPSRPGTIETAKPSSDDKPGVRLHGPDQDRPGSSWDSLQTCIQNIKDDHYSTCREYLNAVAEKEQEVKRLKGIVDELLGFAFTQQEHLKKADAERAAKDRQIAQLLKAVARNENALGRVTRKGPVDLGAVSVDPPLNAHGVLAEAA